MTSFLTSKISKLLLALLGAIHAVLVFSPSLVPQQLGEDLLILLLLLICST